MGEVESHGGFGTGEGGGVFGAAHAALVELVHEFFLGDGFESEAREERRGEGQDDDVAGAQGTTAVWVTMFTPILKASPSSV